MAKYPAPTEDEPMAIAYPMTTMLVAQTMKMARFRSRSDK